VDEADGMTCKIHLSSYKLKRIKRRFWFLEKIIGKEWEFYRCVCGRVTTVFSTLVAHFLITISKTRYALTN